MSGESFVVAIEIPSIKQFVFGTDTLNEVRGASALLDWLNRHEMKRILCEHSALAQAEVETIYANGGSAQFLVHGSDEQSVRSACTSVVQHIREQTGGEVRPVFGFASYAADADTYEEAIHKAHFQRRCRRDFAGSYPATTLMPAVMECQSASHLPAVHVYTVEDEVAYLSAASYRKREKGRSARKGDGEEDVWTKWMTYLENEGSWPQQASWSSLRYEDISCIGDNIGVIYADGNAMGKVVQAIDRPEISKLFSCIVDDSISQACFQALSEMCAQEIGEVRTGQSHALPADILLLGGDDLLVVLPAERALDFTLLITDLFEDLTRQKIAALPDEIGQFFHAQIGQDQGFTISCGVAIVQSKFPFYLALDLAEELLQNAKKKPAFDPDPVRIDFHIVAGANSHDLEQVRRDDYLDQTIMRRTLRPLSREQLKALRTSVQELRVARFPRSKLHALREAALAESARQAGWRIKDIFGRSQHAAGRLERHALREAICRLKPSGFGFCFPWFVRDKQSLLCVADLAEAYDLFPRQ